MELKVRADGILRVVCGVTENTTCQEVVKALAYAMGRTGRFTLIEKWRENERPLLPSEFPLQILHKWGEYANEVQFILQQSDKQTFKTEVLREPLKSRDKLVQNYNPPIPKDSGMRRSLTFSGAHNSVAPSSKRKTGLQTLHENNSADDANKLNIPQLSNHTHNNQNYIQVQNELYPPQEPSVKLKTVSQNSHNHISHPSSSSPSPQIFHQRTASGSDSAHHRHNSNSHHHTHHNKPNLVNHPAQSNLQESKSHPRLPSHNRVMPPGAASPRLPRQSAQQRLEQSRPKNGSRENVTGVIPPENVTGHVTGQTRNLKSGHNTKSTSILPIVQSKTRSSAFQPVLPNKHKHINIDHSKQNGDIDDIPIYSVSAVQNNDIVEEYDLDSNFPDIVRDSKKEILIEEYHVPSDKDINIGKSYKQEDPEMTKMQRLVTIQQERIKMQESQLELLDTELTSLEEKDQDRDKQLKTIGEEVIELEQKQQEYEVEITDLEKIMWVDQIESEKQKEKQFRSEISELKIRISSCESDIGKLDNKVTNLNDEISKEQKELDEEKQKLKEENKKLSKELVEVQDELDTKIKSFEVDKEALDNLEEELRKADEQATKQQEEVESMEKELKEVNMEMFNKPQLSPSSEKSDSGEAVLKMLEGRISPGIGLKSPRIGLNRKMIQSPLSKVISTSKNPNGVWV